MTSRRQGYGLLVVALILLIINIYLFCLDFQDQNRHLTFAVLDIGQGDALFIESPTGTQILVDGGPPRKILNELSKIMSPFDRSIDAIIITNPDQDHIGGLLEVLEIYEVDSVFESGTFNDSKIFQNLKSEIKNKNIPNIFTKAGMRLHLGGGVVIDILFPDRDVFDWSPNDGSIVAKLSYGDISIMLTGDATAGTEKIILDKYSISALKSDVLKVGHHGSRTSSSSQFIETVSPQYALISSGKDNKYGHPHEEVLAAFSAMKAEVFRTDLFGTIVMESDGKYVKIKP